MIGVPRMDVLLNIKNLNRQQVTGGCVQFQLCEVPSWSHVFHVGECQLQAHMCQDVTCKHDGEVKSKKILT